MRTKCPYCNSELILEFINLKRCVKCGQSKPIQDYAPHNTVLLDQLQQAQDEREKYRLAATVMCGDHIGVPQKQCPVCELEEQKADYKKLAKVGLHDILRADDLQKQLQQAREDLVGIAATLESRGAKCENDDPKCESLCCRIHGLASALQQAREEVSQMQDMVIRADNARDDMEQQLAQSQEREKKTFNLWEASTNRETRLQDANIALQARLDEAEKVITAARCVRHWHDSGGEGMVVSGEHVRFLWAALNDYDAFLAAQRKATSGKPIQVKPGQDEMGDRLREAAQRKDGV